MNNKKNIAWLIAFIILLLLIILSIYNRKSTYELIYQNKELVEKQKKLNEINDSLILLNENINNTIFELKLRLKYYDSKLNSYQDEIKTYNSAYTDSINRYYQLDSTERVHKVRQLLH